MPEYIQKNLLKFQNTIPKNPEDALFKSDPKKYWEKVQLVKEIEGTPKFSETAIKVLQKKIDILLFYVRSIDTTLLIALITLASKQAHET